MTVITSIQALKENEIERYSAGYQVAGACKVVFSAQVDSEGQHFTHVSIQPDKNFALVTLDGNGLKGLAALFDATVMRVGELLHVPTGIVVQPVDPTATTLTLHLTKGQSFNCFVKQLYPLFNVAQLQIALKQYRQAVGAEAYEGDRFDWHAASKTAEVGGGSKGAASVGAVAGGGFKGSASAGVGSSVAAASDVTAACRLTTPRATSVSKQKPAAQESATADSGSFVTLPEICHL